jgi:hypothetical protein
MDAMNKRGEAVPWSIVMPNNWNYSFDFRIFVMLVPVFYIVGFPSLYGHMVK